jgi:polysaccharide pyruvyl transferase WcaK-like protein
MNILVFGFYKPENNENIGDNLFIEAFKKLFPQHHLTFTDHFSYDNIKGIDAVFFGGGSFLFDDQNISLEICKSLLTKKIIYIGVGVEQVINKFHLKFMKEAKLIATRSKDQVERLKEINPNTMYLPDLVYSLQDQVKISAKMPKSVLIMPNVSVLPKNSSPHWQYSAYEYFKSEFCQFLDYLVENEYNIGFFSMCKSEKLDDDWAANSLISFMNRGNSKFLLHRPTSLEEITSLISKYQIIYTQRFHGIVLSEMVNTPYVSIHHHSKLERTCDNGVFVSYYESNKDKYIKALNIKQDNKLINSTIFQTLSLEVANLLMVV